MTNAQIKEVDGFIGNYKGVILHQGKKRNVDFGTIIIATGFREIDLKGQYQYKRNNNILSQTELEQHIKNKTLK